MLAGIIALAKLARGAKNVSRFDEMFGHLPKVKPRTNLSDLKNVLINHVTKENPIDMGSTVKAIKKDPKYSWLGEGISGSGPSIYRGRTIVDDPSQISTKKQMNILRDDEKFFTDDPIEAAHHAYATQSVDNPAIILRMAKEAADTRSPTTPFGRQVLPHGHSIVSNEQEAMIPVLMNIIVRLKKMGFKDAEIFKYVKQLYKDPRPKKIFNSGGIVSLVL
jgi:hypothetical protein